MFEVTLIIPLYNGSRHLRSCLDSVAHQTLKQMEVLLIDDGSTDETVQIAQQYCRKNDYWRLISQKNSGVSAARNHGLAEAQSLYVAFLDQDDVLHPQAMEFLYKMITTYQTDAAAFEIEFVADNFTIEEKPKLYNIESEIDKAQLIDYPMKKFFKNKKGDKIYVWNKLYKKQAISHIEFPLSVQPAEDTVFTLKTMLTIKNMVCSDKKLLYYRQNDNSVSKQGITKNYIYSHAVAAEEMRKFFASYKNDVWLNAHLRFYLTNFIFKALISRPLRLISGNNREELLNYARKYAFEFYVQEALMPNLLGFRKEMACRLFFKKHERLARFLL